MPPSYGSTGQHADAATGLDYYNARYYDPTAGQFASADAALPGGGFDLLGLSRYAYVEGNPVIRTDPSGNVAEIVDAGGCFSDCNASAGTVISGPSPIGSALSGAENFGGYVLSGAGNAIGGVVGTIGNAGNGVVGGILNAFATPAYAPADEGDLTQLTDRAKDQGVGAALPVMDSLTTVAMVVGMVDGTGEVLAILRAQRAAELAAEATTKVSIASARRAAVRMAWRDERALVANTGEGTRAWTEAEQTELLNTGKIRGYRGHHINSVAGSPELASDPNNIRFLNQTEHLAEHSGRWQTRTYGDLLDRSW
jgi:RHS repeat-associated protein